MMIVVAGVVWFRLHRFAFGLQPILLRMSLWTPFLLIDGVCLLRDLVTRRLGFGLIFGCAFVYFHGADFFPD